jgi:8-oxo-dGTP pyrophosphatase MutT (NUDIX family)
MTWTPHATVATLVEKDGKFLIVEEVSHGKAVFNQPAGHIEQGETIQAAAIRETLEETGWRVKLNGFIGLYTYTAPQNGVCYYRFCFAAEAIEKTDKALDHDIIAAHWLNLDEIRDLGDKLRSPLVVKCYEDYYEKPHLPLETIFEHRF